MMFRIVFWDILPCKKIVDRRFRGASLIHDDGGSTFMELCEISGSHGGEYDVQNCFLGYTAV
jgi:hypothetical protein